MRVSDILGENWFRARPKAHRVREDAQLPPPGTMERYIAQNPQVVSTDMDDLIHNLRDHASEGALFKWAIGRLPDGRFIECSERALKSWGIPVVKKGDNEDL